MTDAAPTGRRPLDDWIGTIAALLARRTAAVLKRQGLSRTEWRVMIRLERGPATHLELVAELAPERGEVAPADALSALVLRRVAEITGRGYALTPSGELLHDETRAALAELRRTAAEGIPPGDWATTMASLERIARNLGARS